jgi:hypothetical protein
MLSAGGIAAFPLLVSFLHGLGLRPFLALRRFPFPPRALPLAGLAPRQSTPAGRSMRTSYFPLNLKLLAISADKKERLACYYNRRVVFPFSQPLAQLRYMSEIWNLRVANLSFGKY